MLILLAVPEHLSQLTTTVTYYYRKYVNNKLNTYVLKYSTGNTAVTCSLLCQDDTRCLSFNYGIPVNKNMTVLQTSTYTKKMFIISCSQH